MKSTHATERGAVEIPAARQDPRAGVEKMVRADTAGRPPDRRVEAEDRTTEEAGYGYGV